ncbi:MAG: hypothetical protein J7J36_02315 [Thermoplasmata archaeon]|nr:hypothetical protein [Thermoplasmata archaeon]
MKKLFVLVIAAIMILPITIPRTNSAEEKGTIKLYMIGHGKFVKNEVEISTDEANILIEKLTKAVHAYEPYKNRDNLQLTENEKQQIEEIFNDAFSELRKAGLLPRDMDAKAMGLLPHFGISMLNPVLSCGVGISYIPLYPGEAFIGFMLRPILVQYFLLGYTGCINLHLIPPRLEYWDWVGTQTFLVWGFAGIYIDFSSIGLGIPPLQFLMGESLLTAGVDWPA